MTPIYVYIYIYIYIYIYTHTHTHTNIHTNIHVQMDTHVACAMFLVAVSRHNLSYDTKRIVGRPPNALIVNASKKKKYSEDSLSHIHTSILYSLLYIHTHTHS